MATPRTCGGVAVLNLDHDLDRLAETWPGDCDRGRLSVGRVRAASAGLASLLNPDLSHRVLLRLGLPLATSCIDLRPVVMKGED
jgi:hypothetical protein